MKNFSTLLIFLLTCNVYSQSPDYASTCVTYKVGWTGILDTAMFKTSSTKSKINFSRTLEALSLIECKLYYNTNKSSYSIVDKFVGGNANYYNRAKLFFKNTYFYDRIVKERIKRKDLMGVYNIIQPFEQYKWSITTESKVISGYKCYKATGTYTVKSKSNLDTTTSVMAWFAPEIAVQYGPNGFDSLPGLILEVIYEGNYIQATKIELAIENQKIKLERPDHGFYISQKEFDDKIFEENQKIFNRK